MVWSLFGKQSKNTRSAATQAAARAQWEARSEYGRAGQARVANVLGVTRKNKSKGLTKLKGPANSVAREIKENTEKYKKDLKATASAISSSTKTALIEFADDLNQKLAEMDPRPVERSKKEDATVSVAIPIVVARVLGFIIGLAILVLGVFTIAIDIVFESDLTGVTAAYAFVLMMGGSGPNSSRARPNTFEQANPAFGRGD